MPKNKCVAPKTCPLCCGLVVQDYREYSQMGARGCGTGFSREVFAIKDGSHCEECGVKFVFNVEEKGDENG